MDCATFFAFITRANEALCSSGVASIAAAGRRGSSIFTVDS